MAVFGNIGVYDEKVELFEDYSDRCDAFIEANGITKEKRANFFLATVGASAYKLLKDLSRPSLPNTKTYVELKQLLKNHYSPKPIVIAERHKFWTATQGEQESVSAYIVRLKNLSSGCNFGEFLDEALRDRLVSGLHGKMSKTQTHLLTLADLTFEQAKTKCLADEMATAATKQCMSSMEVTHAVYSDKKSSRPHSTSENRHLFRVKCNGCGGNHRRSDCPHKDTVCHKCGKKGHLKRVCRSPRKAPERVRNGSSVPNFQKKESNTKNIVGVDDELASGSNETSTYSYFGLNNLKEINHTSPYVITMSFGVSKVIDIPMEIDTGAARSTISETVYMSDLADLYPLRKSDVVLRGYTGEIVPILGCINVPVRFKNSPYLTEDIVVVKGKCTSFLGRDLLTKLRLDWKDIFKVKSEGNVPSSVPKVELPSQSPIEPVGFREFLQHYRQLFSDQDTGIKEFTASIKLKPNTKPVFQKYRSVPYSLVDKVEQEYDHLTKAEIVTPVAFSEWATPTVHVVKPNGSIRVCGDYKKVNDLIEDDGYKLPNV